MDKTKKLKERALEADCDDFYESLSKLLFREAAAKVQVLYVTLANGNRHIFLGSPMSDKDCDQIVDFVFGESIDPVVFSDMAAIYKEDVTAH